MGAFLDSVREVFGQVFGKADFQKVLDDHFEFSETFPEEQRRAMFVPQARERGAARPGGSRRGRAASTEWGPPGKDAPFRGCPAVDRGPASVPADLAMFESSGAEEEQEGVLPARRITEGVPHRRASVPPGSASSTLRRSDAPPREAEGGLDASGFALLDSPYPADPFAREEDEDEPPALDTLAITGEMEAPHSPAAAPPDPLRLESPVARPAVARPPVRLRPVPPPDPPLATLDDFLAEGEAGDSCAEEADRNGSATSSAAGSLAGLSAGASCSRRPRARIHQSHGPPPASIWDDRAIRDAVASDLRREALGLSDAGSRRILAWLRKAIETEPLHLPPFPAAARRLLGKDGGVPTDDEVIEVVKTEPTLAGNVVKVANSPFYMAAVPVTSLGGAVMRIGLDQVRRVSLAAVVGSSWEIEGFQGVAAGIRLHAYATALAAEALAAGTEIDAGEAFLAGLLHDAGEALAYRLVWDAAEKERRKGREWQADPILMRRVARQHHQRLGALFLGGWDLSAGVASAMAFHHHPEAAEPRFLPLVRIIHVADAIAWRGVEHARTRTWRDALALRARGATPDDVSRAVAVDGIDRIPVDDLLFQAPRGFDASRLRGVLRSVLLRLDRSDLSPFDGGDAITDTSC